MVTLLLKSLAIHSGVAGTAVSSLWCRGGCRLNTLQAIIANCGLFMWLHATGVVDHAVDNVMKDLAKDKVT